MCKYCNSEPNYIGAWDDCGFEEELVVERDFNDGASPCITYWREDDHGVIQQHFRINFCPMCGRKLTDGDDAEKKEMEALDDK